MFEEAPDLSLNWTQNPSNDGQARARVNAKGITQTREELKVGLSTHCTPKLKATVLRQGAGSRAEKTWQADSCWGTCSAGSLA